MQFSSVARFDLLRVGGAVSDRRRRAESPALRREPIRPCTRGLAMASVSGMCVANPAVRNVMTCQGPPDAAACGKIRMTPGSYALLRTLGRKEHDAGS